mgnify:CR=1 FL=1
MRTVDKDSLSCENGSTDAKRPYVKPRLRIVELAVKEVLAEGCKTVYGDTAVGGSDCTAGTCIGVGSS